MTSTMHSADRVARLLIWAEELLSNGLPHQARSLTRLVVDDAPSDFYVRLLLARCELLAGSAGRAEAAARIALELATTDPQRGEALCLQAMALAGLRSSDRAVAAAEEAARIAPEQPMTRVTLVLGYAGTGRYDDAHREAETLAETAGFEGHARWLAGMVDLAAGRMPQAEAALRQAWEMDTDDEDLALMLAALLLRERKSEEALETLVHAVKRRPDSQSLRMTVVSTAGRIKGRPWRALSIWLSVFVPISVLMTFGPSGVPVAATLSAIGVTGYLVARVTFRDSSVPPAAEVIEEAHFRTVRRQMGRAATATLLVCVGLTLGLWITMYGIPTLLHDWPSTAVRFSFPLVALGFVGCVVGLWRLRSGPRRIDCRCETTRALLGREAVLYGKRHLIAGVADSEPDAMELTCPRTGRRWILLLAGSTRATCLAQLGAPVVD